MNSQELQIYDIDMHWHIPFWQTSFFFYLMLGLILLLTAVFLSIVVRMIRTRKKVMPYWQAAQYEVQSLKIQHEHTQQEASLFYAQLVAITKDYLTAHYAANFTSKTDPECLDQLKIKERDTKIVTLVQDIMEGSLLVRFARADSARQMMQQDVSRALKVIDYTQHAKETFKNNESSL